MIVAWTYNELAADFDSNDVSLQLYLPRPGTATSRHFMKVDEEIIQVDAWGDYVLADIVAGTFVDAGATVDPDLPIIRGVRGTQKTTHRKGAPIWSRWEISTFVASVFDDFTGPTAPVADDEVHSVESDGKGGWYIGGDFTDLDGTTYTRCARVKAIGEVDTNFVAECDDTVLEMKLSPDGRYLAIAGLFTTYNSVSVQGLVIVEPDTGVLIYAPPITVGTDGVKALAWDGNHLFFGGDLDDPTAALENLGRLEFGGPTRSQIWSIDFSWAPQQQTITPFTIHSMLIHDGKLYIGGDFTTMDGETRGRGCAYDLDTLLINSWNPACAGGGVHAIYVQDGGMFIGGDFTTTHGVARVRVAKVTPDYGTPIIDFTADANGIVKDFMLVEDELWIVGDFTTINGTTNGANGIRVARVNVETGALLAAHPFNANAIVNRLRASSSRAMIAGDFTVGRIRILNANHAFSPIGRYKFELELEPAPGERIESVVWKASKNGNVFYTSNPVTEFKTVNGKIVIPGPDINLPAPDAEYKIEAVVTKNSGTETHSVGFSGYTDDAIYLIPIGRESGDRFDESDGLTMPSPSNPGKSGNTYTLSLPDQTDVPQTMNDHYFYRLFAILRGDGGNRLVVDRAGPVDTIIMPQTNLYQAELDWDDKNAPFTLDITFEDTIGMSAVTAAVTHPGADSDVLNPDQVQIEREVRIGGTLTGPQFGRWVSDWMPVPGSFQVQYGNQGNTGFEYRYRCRYRDFRRDGVEDQRGPVAVTSQWSDWTPWV